MTKTVIIYALIVFQFLLLLFAILIIMYMGLVMISFKNTVPYVPTPRKAIKKMIQAAGLKPGEKAADLGSGTGRLLLPAVRKYDIKAVGIEKSFLWYAASCLKSFFSFKKGKVKFILGDFNNCHLNDFDVIFAFITPEGLRSLKEKFATELRPGSRIVSYLFPLEDASLFTENKIPVQDGKKSKYIFVYTKRQ